MTMRFDPIAEAARQWREHWGEDTAPPMTATISVMRAFQIMLARLNQALEPYELTYPRYEALMLLYYSRSGSLPLGKMSVRLQLHQTSLTPLVDGLVRLNYAARVPHPTDRRTTLAQITDSGLEIALRATELLNADGFGLAALDEDEQERVTELLRTLRQEAGDFE